MDPKLVTLSLLFGICTVCGFPVEHFDFASDNLVDLSYPFDRRTVYWPTISQYSFQLHSARSSEVDHYGFIFRSNRYSAAEHGGTHLDAPYQRTIHGYDPAEIPLEQLFGPLALINVSTKVEANNDYRVATADIDEYEKKYGRIANGSFVFMFSDWGKRWPNVELLFNSETPKEAKSLHFPSFHRDTVEYLIRERDIRGIGVDTPSTDFGQQHNVNEPPEGVHRMLANNNRIGIEFVANLDKMPAKGASVMVLPMKISRGSGSPTRIVGMLPFPE